MLFRRRCVCVCFFLLSVLQLKLTKKEHSLSPSLFVWFFFSWLSLLFSFDRLLYFSMCTVQRRFIIHFGDFTKRTHCKNKKTPKKWTEKLEKKWREKIGCIEETVTYINISRKMSRTLAFGLCMSVCVRLSFLNFLILFLCIDILNLWKSSFFCSWLSPRFRLWKNKMFI